MPRPRLSVIEKWGSRQGVAVAANNVCNLSADWGEKRQRQALRHRLSAENTSMHSCVCTSLCPISSSSATDVFLGSDVPGHHDSFHFLRQLQMCGLAQQRCTELDRCYAPNGIRAPLKLHAAETLTLSPRCLSSSPACWPCVPSTLPPYANCWKRAIICKWFNLLIEKRWGRLQPSPSGCETGEEK